MKEFANNPIRTSPITIITIITLTKKQLCARFEGSIYKYKNIIYYTHVHVHVHSVSHVKHFLKNQLKVKLYCNC